MRICLPKLLVVAMVIFTYAPFLSEEEVRAEMHPMSESPKIEIQKGSERKLPLKIKKNKTVVNGEAHGVRLIMNFRGETTESYLFIARDPKTGLFWPAGLNLDPGNPAYYGDRMPEFMDHKFHLTDDAIVGFQLLDSRVAITEFYERQSSFQKAVQSVISRMKAKATGVTRDPIQGKQVIVDLSELLGRDFFKGSKRVANYRPSKLIDVTRTDANWVVMLEGPDGETAAVSLSNDYRVQSAVRDGKKVFPDSKNENEDEQQP